MEAESRDIDDRPEKSTTVHVQRNLRRIGLKVTMKGGKKRRPMQRNTKLTGFLPQRRQKPPSSAFTKKTSWYSDDPQNEFENFHDPRSKFQNFDDPRSEFQNFDDPRSEFQNFDDPRSKFQNFDDPRSKFQNFDDPRSEFQNFDDPRSEFQNFDDPRSKFQNFDDPRSESQNFDDPRSESQNRHDPRSKIQNRHNPRRKFQNFDDPRSEFQNFHDPRHELLNYDDDPRSEFQNSHDPRDIFQNYDDHDDPRSEFKNFRDPRSEFQNLNDPRDIFLNYDDHDDPRSEFKNFRDPRSEFQNLNDPRGNGLNSDDPRPYSDSQNQCQPFDDSQVAADDPRPFSLPSSQNSGGYERPPSQIPTRVLPLEGKKSFRSHTLPPPKVLQESATLPGDIPSRLSTKYINPKLNSELPKKQKPIRQNRLSKPSLKQTHHKGPATLKIPPAQQTSSKEDQYHPMNVERSSIACNSKSVNRPTNVGTTKKPPVRNHKSVNRKKSKACFKSSDSSVTAQSVTITDLNARTVVKFEKMCQKKSSRSRDDTRVPRTSTVRRVKSQHRASSKNTDRSSSPINESKNRHSRRDEHRSCTSAKCKSNWHNRDRDDHAALPNYISLSAEEDVLDTDEKWSPKKCHCTFKHDLAIVIMKLRNELRRLEHLLKNVSDSAQRWGLMTFINELKYQLSEPESIDIITGKCDRVEPYTCKEELQRKLVKLKLLHLIHGTEEEDNWLRTEMKKVKRGLLMLQLEHCENISPKKLSGVEQNERLETSSKNENVLEKPQSNSFKEFEGGASSTLGQTDLINYMKCFPKSRYTETYSNLEEPKSNSLGDFEGDARGTESQINANIMKYFPHSGCTEIYSLKRNDLEEPKLNSSREFQDDMSFSSRQTNAYLKKGFHMSEYAETSSQNDDFFEQSESNYLKKFQNDNITLPRTWKKFNIMKYSQSVECTEIISKDEDNLDQAESGSFENFHNEGSSVSKLKNKNFEKHFQRVESESNSISKVHDMGSNVPRLTNTNLEKHFQRMESSKSYSRNGDNLEEAKSYSYRNVHDSESNISSLRNTDIETLVRMIASEIVSRSNLNPKEPESSSPGNFSNDRRRESRLMNPDLEKQFQRTESSEIFSRNEDNYEEMESNNFRSFSTARDTLSSWMKPNPEKRFQRMELLENFSQNEDCFEEPESNSFQNFHSNKTGVSRLTNPSRDEKGSQRMGLSEIFSRRSNGTLEEPELNRFSSFPNERNSVSGSINQNLDRGSQGVESSEIFSKNNDDFKRPESNVLENYFQRTGSSEIFSRNKDSFEEPESNLVGNFYNERSSVSGLKNQNLKMHFQRTQLSEILSKTENSSKTTSSKNFRDEKNSVSGLINTNAEEHFQIMGSSENFSTSDEHVEEFESSSVMKFHRGRGRGRMIGWKMTNRGRGLKKMDAFQRGRATTSQFRGTRGNRARVGRKRPIQRTRGRHPAEWIN